MFFRNTEGVENRIFWHECICYTLELTCVCGCMMNLSDRERHWKWMIDRTNGKTFGLKQGNWSFARVKLAQPKWPWASSSTHALFSDWLSQLGHAIRVLHEVASRYVCFFIKDLSVKMRHHNQRLRKENAFKLECVKFMRRGWPLVSVDEHGVSSDWLRRFDFASYEHGLQDVNL